MNSTESLFSEHGIETSEANLEIMSQLLKNWDLVVELKDKADFWVGTVSIKNVDEMHTDRFTSKLVLPGNELDNLSLYSGDTECENDLTSLVCNLFHDKSSADVRYVDLRDELELGVLY